MTATLEEQAIKAALNQNWTRAIEINKKIIKETPQNAPALNRIGKAFYELGKNEEAIKAYKKVIKIDPFNPIANKNLKRLSKNRSKNNNQKNSILSGNIFLEEPSKTKMVKLIRLASPLILSQQDNGDEVFFIIKKRLISIFDNSKNYLGALPEDLSQRLIKFIKGGNQYQAYIKNVDLQLLEIFIREVSRSKKFIETPSFPQGKFNRL
ncbi:MAG: tetratricopeptide repeat protein [Candidatus Shapirobacteria bacterium]|nr:tetratricopeptide repeat protein [Candidatus Shapirobacteria bacterium]